ncbi:MAG: PAS domain-containing protein, partial [Verrucomicrobiota bacterium]
MFDERQMLLDNIDAQVWYLKDIVTYGVVNKAHADFLNVDKGDLKNKSLWDIFSSEEAATCKDGNRRIFDEKRQIKTEEWLVNGNGEKRLLAITKTPKLDQNGKVDFVVCSAVDITERKQAEEALRKTQFTVDKSPLSIFWISPEGKFIYANEGTEKKLGYSREELLSMHVWDVDPHYPPESRQEQWELYQKEGTLSFESEHCRKDGTKFPVRVNSYLLSLEGRKMEVAEAEDITDRKQAEEALLEREKRFQKMLGVVPDMVSIHDRDMNILYSNWNGFGAVPQEQRILNTKCYKTYRNRDDICPDCKAKIAFQTKKAFQETMELPAGSWVDLRVIPILDDNNNVEFFVEWVRDITEIKQSEKEAKQQQALLEGVMNGISDVLAVQWPDHTIMRYNQAGYDLLGMTPAQVQGKKCYELLGRDRECTECATRKALKTGKLEQLEKYLPELGIYLDCRSNPVLDGDGNVSHIIEQLRDITDYKCKEQELQQALDDLHKTQQQIVDQERQQALTTMA